MTKANLDGDFDGFSREIGVPLVLTDAGSANVGYKKQDFEGDVTIVNLYNVNVDELEIGFSGFTASVTYAF